MSKRGFGDKIKLSSYDDMFGVESSESVDAIKGEAQIVDIPLSELHTFENHPFRVVDDESMEEMVESIKEYGVLVPAIARPRKEGGYELISGHRRKRASELAGKETMMRLQHKMSTCRYQRTDCRSIFQQRLHIVITTG